MKTLTKILTLTTLLTLLSLNSVNAQTADSTKIKSNKKESSRYFLMDNTLTNKNMFFGMNFGNHPMNQLYTEGGNNNFVFSTWTNYNLNSNKIVEVDFTAGYTKTIQLGENTNLTLQPTAAYYTFPNSTMGDCGEIYLKSNFTSPVIDASMKAGQAFGKDSGSGRMIQLTASKTINPFETVSITGTVEAVYNDDYFSGQEGISHTGANISLSYTPKKADNITLTGKINAQKRGNSDFEGLVNNESYGSISLTYIFK